MEIDVKKILLKPIEAKVANNFIKKYHYSGKYNTNSVLHFGCFYNNILQGVLSFGSPLDKRKMLGLVTNTKWNDMLELSRMAFLDGLPKNSESRCISIAIRLIKKKYPNIKWILSFADATQCGDGTIYRASGFHLTAIKRNNQIIKTQDGKITHKHSLKQIKFKGLRGDKQYKASNLLQLTKGSYSTNKYFKALGQIFEELPGFQLRYIYLIDKSQKITVPIIPFSKIQELGAGMYKGVKKCGSSVNGSTSVFQTEGNVQINSAAL